MKEGHRNIIREIERTNLALNAVRLSTATPIFDFSYGALLAGATRTSNIFDTAINGYGIITAIKSVTDGTYYLDESNDKISWVIVHEAPVIANTDFSESRLIASRYFRVRFVNGIVDNAGGISDFFFSVSQRASVSQGENTFGANSASGQVQVSTYGHSVSFLLATSNSNRKELIVLNHGTIGSFHLYLQEAQPLTGTFISPIELFFHDTYFGDKWLGKVWAQWHEPEEQIDAAVAVTFTDVDDFVTLATHGLNTHSEVTFPTIVTTGGISINTKYYVMPAVTPTASTFRLATTQDNARNGVAIDLTANGTGTMFHSKPFTGFFNYTEISA